MLRVDLGCGLEKPAGFIGVDIHPGEGIDIVADLTQRFPFADNSVDELRAHDLIEHLPDRLHTMNEIWRVCKPGAIVDLFVPSTDGRGAFQDPTHISYWNINSFFYYCVDSPALLALCHRYGFHGAFKIIELENVESPGNIIHVKAILTVVKPDPPSSSQTATQQPVPRAAQPQGSPPVVYPHIPPLATQDARPLFSVVIPTYNPDIPLLRKAISSVVDQFHQDAVRSDVEILVVDDCSTQTDIEGVIRDFNNDWITLIKQPRNLGLLDNWNDGIKRASGVWVHLLHQDDVVLPGFYQQLKQGIVASSQIGALFCRHAYIDRHDQQQFLSGLEQAHAGILANWLEKIAVVQRIQFASMIVKREVYENLGGFCAEAGSAADWEMWKRIAAHYPVWYEPQVLACYRLHDASESSRLIQTGQNIIDTLQAIEISQHYIPPAQVAQLSNAAREHYAMYALDSAEQLLAEKAYESALAQMSAGLKCSASQQVTNTIIRMITELTASPASKSDPLSQQVSQTLSAYHQRPQDSVVQGQLQALRSTVSRALLSLEAAEVEQICHQSLGKSYTLLLQAGIQNLVGTTFTEPGSEPTSD